MKAISSRACTAGIFFLACFFTSIAAFSQVEPDSQVTGSAFLAERHRDFKTTEVEDLFTVVSAGLWNKTAKQPKKLKPSDNVPGSHPAIRR